MKTPKKNVNSSKIARIAGVSRSTVSRVINNYPDVSEKTREKVLKTIKMYNYYPNIFAQELAGKKKKTIGLFMITDGQLADDFIINSIMVSVFDTASTNAYHVLTGVVKASSEMDSIKRIREAFYQRRIDAGIFVGYVNHEPMIEELLAEGFIIGVMGQDIPGRTEPNRIVYNFNYRETAENAVSYLARLGHRRIGIINGDMRRYAGSDKCRGFKDGLHKEQIAVNDKWIAYGEFSEASGYENMKRLLANPDERPTGVCCANDSIAFGAVRAIREKNLRIPEDISIIGIDDHVFSALTNPPLTTFKFDYFGLLKAMTLKVIQVVEQGTGSESIRVQFNSELVERESCRRI